MAELTDLQKDLLTLAADIKRLEAEYSMFFVPFHRFAALVKDQVSKLRDSGTAEVAFRVAVKDGKVNFTVRGLKGGGT